MKPVEPARSNADWYALLDLAALRHTLIADPDGVYDPCSYNDRLLLGLRGMMSEAELHLLRLRLEAGRLRQIERGDYRQQLPTGLVRLPDGRVVKDPDLQVQRTLELIFALFAELGSCQKVLRRLRDMGVRVPRRQTGGADAGAMVWKVPSEAVIYETLHNPAYAGAFVYGRRAAAPDRSIQQRDRRHRHAVDQWPTIHYNVYPGYISSRDLYGQPSASGGQRQSLSAIHPRRRAFWRCLAGRDCRLRALWATSAG